MNSKKLKYLREELRNTLADTRFECEDNYELTPDKLALGYLRYEAVRKLNPADFFKLFALHLSVEDFSLDYLVDLLVCGKTVDELFKLAQDNSEESESDDEN